MPDRSRRHTDKLSLLIRSHTDKLILLICYRTWAHRAISRRKLQRVEEKLTTEHRGELARFSVDWEHSRGHALGAFYSVFSRGYRESLLHACYSRWRRWGEQQAAINTLENVRDTANRELRLSRHRGAYFCSCLTDVVCVEQARAAFDAWALKCELSLARFIANRELILHEADTQQRVDEAEQRANTCEVSLRHFRTHDVASVTEGLAAIFERRERPAFAAHCLSAWAAAAREAATARATAARLAQAAKDFEQTAMWFSSRALAGAEATAERIGLMRTESERWLLLTACMRQWSDFRFPLRLEKGLREQRVRHDEECWELVLRFAANKARQAHRPLLVRVILLWGEVCRNIREQRLLTTGFETLGYAGDAGDTGDGKWRLAKYAAGFGKKTRSAPTSLLAWTERLELPHCLRSWRDFVRSEAARKEFAEAAAAQADHASALEVELRQACNSGLAMSVVVRWHLFARDHRARRERESAHADHSAELTRQAVEMRSRPRTLVLMLAPTVLAGLHRRWRRISAFRFWRLWLSLKRCERMVATLEFSREDHGRSMRELKVERRAAVFRAVNLATSKAANSPLVDVFLAWLLLQMRSHVAARDALSKKAGHVMNVPMTQSVSMLRLKDSEMNLRDVWQNWARTASQLARERMLVKSHEAELKAIKADAHGLMRVFAVKAVARHEKAVQRLFVVISYRLWHRVTESSKYEKEAAARQSERKAAFLKLERKVDGTQGQIYAILSRVCRKLTRVSLQRCFAALRQDVALRAAARHLRSRVDESAAELAAARANLQTALRSHGALAAESALTIAKSRYSQRRLELRAIVFAWSSLVETARAQSIKGFEIKCVDKQHSRERELRLHEATSSSLRLGVAFNLLALEKRSFLATGAIMAWRMLALTSGHATTLWKAQLEADEALEKLIQHKQSQRARMFDRAIRLLESERQLGNMQFCWFVWSQTVSVLAMYRAKRRHVKELERRKVDLTLKLPSSPMLECLLAWHGLIRSRLALDRLPVPWPADVVVIPAPAPADTPLRPSVAATLERIAAARRSMLQDAP